MGAQFWYLTACRLPVGTRFARLELAQFAAGCDLNGIIFDIINL
jgi:hypothetical protein